MLQSPLRANSILLGNQDFLGAEREYCSRSLRNFSKRAWHVLEPSAELKWGWCLDAICDHLEAVQTGEIRRLLINVPPGCMKSLLSGVMLPAFEWGPRAMPYKRFIGTSHNQNLAVRDNVKCRRVIESSWFQSLWPIKMTTDQNAKFKFENDKTGLREAMAFTTMTGTRGDTVLLDDPLSVDDAKSDAELQNVEDTFTESLPTRLNDPDKSAIIVIMQRLNERDPSGLILSRGLPYVHLMLPMEFEIERRCHTVLNFTDPRVEDGELLFPERFPAQTVEDLKKTLREYATAGQLQQRPAPRGGGMFKREWFTEDKFIDEKDVPARTIWVRGWDLAGSTRKRSPYTAGVKIGRTPNGQFVIGDVRRKKLTPAAVELFMVKTAKADGKKVRGSYPQDPGQAGKSQAAYLAKLFAGYKYTFSTETGSKATRAEPLAAQAESGNVYLVKAPWNEDFLDEATVFPNGQYADQIDAASRSFAKLLETSSYTLENV